MLTDLDPIFIQFWDLDLLETEGEPFHDLVDEKLGARIVHLAFCSLTAVGVVLVIALLCAPVLIHLEQSTSLKALMLRASATGLVLTSGGIGLAIGLDLPPGPLIGVLCVLLLLSKTLIPARKS